MKGVQRKHFRIKPIGVVAHVPSFANGCCIFPNYGKSFIKQGVICQWLLHFS